MGELAGDATPHGSTFDSEGLRTALTRTRSSELTRRLAAVRAVGAPGPARAGAASSAASSVEPDARGERR